MKYRAEIDGLRALAVIPVILYHAGLESFSGGFVGVDVFFVISGYLITSIILAEKKQGTFSLVNFYERRARRILPALFLVMFASLPFAWFWLLPSHMKDFSQSLVAVSSFASNFLFWQETGYWGVENKLKPLLHTWSLAIEEQYYLLFPLFLLLMWKNFKHWIPGSFVLLAIVSLLFSQWGAYNEARANFFLLPSRVWEFVIGASIAYYFIYRQQAIGTQFSHNNRVEVASLTGLVLIVISIFILDESTPYPSFFTLIPTLGTGLIILFATPQTLVGRLLSIKGLVGIGLISYSAYLWHQPLFAFVRHKSLVEPDQWVFAALIVLTLLLSYLSWRYVEQPFRRRGRFTRKAVFSYSLIGSMFFVVIGITGHFTNGFENSWLSRQTEIVQTTYPLVVEDETTATFGLNKDGIQDDGACRFNITKLSSTTEQRIKECYEKYGKGYAILGDSHAIDLYGVVTSANPHPFIIGITQGGCRPHTPRPKCHYNSFLNFVKENSHVFYGVIFEQAGFYLLRKNNKKGDRPMFENSPYGVPLTDIDRDEDHIQKTYHFLKKLSEHTKVVWFGPRIEHHITVKMILQKGCDFDFKLRPNHRQIFDDLDAYIEKLLANDDRVRFVSQNKVFQFRFPDDLMSCTVNYWSDGDHLSAIGEERFGKRFDVLGLLGR